MTIQTNFSSTGTWYKGNLHCHSVVSDGKLTVEQLKDAYKRQGYHFVAFSDHDVFTDYPQLDDADFITLPSCEAGLPTPDGDHRIYHLHVILGSDRQLADARLERLTHGQSVGNIRWEGLQGVQRFIDEMIDRGNLVMFNHPHWSTTELEDILPLRGLFAVEIYNHCSAVLENMGDSSVLWKSLLRHGNRMWATATDDNHNADPFDSPDNDSFGGWVMVKAAELSRSAIAEALAAGSFYASTGPEIHDFHVADGYAVLECSPVEKIYLDGVTRQYQRKLGEPGKNTLTAYRTKLKGGEPFVRVEIIDKDGGRAYSNPIYLDR